MFAPKSPKEIAAIRDKSISDKFTHIFFRNNEIGYSITKNH